MIVRKEYIEKLISWRDEKIIKVVTGIRRCGKSTLLKQYEAYLKKTGVDEKQIITINFEDLKFEELLDYKKLYSYITQRLCPNKRNYIFLDEIQKVSEFEKVVDSLYIKDNTDVYITGSNAYMLSSDLATLLSGRYVEISMLPLSFGEYLEATSLNKEDGFRDYMKYGGLPYLATMEQTEEKTSAYLEGIYNTVIIKDIEDRQRRKLAADQRKIADITLLNTIARYLASVVGSPVSIKSITDYLVSSGRKVSPNTIDCYAEALAESFIFYPVERFDVVGKQLLKSNKKWYIVDLGLRNHILPRKRYDLGFSIENIVYFELLRRGYKTNIGKLDQMEIDFVAQKSGELIYIQVTADMTNEDTFNREIKPLQTIKDNYEKIILTLDNFTVGNYDGIKVINVLEWLVSE